MTAYSALKVPFYVKPSIIQKSSYFKKKQYACTNHDVEQGTFLPKSSQFFYATSSLIRTREASLITAYTECSRSHRTST